MTTLVHVFHALHLSLRPEAPRSPLPVNLEAIFVYFLFAFLIRSILRVVVTRPEYSLDVDPEVLA